MPKINMYKEVKVHQWQNYRGSYKADSSAVSLASDDACKQCLDDRVI